MFSSPMSHYFRHVLLAYRESGSNLAKKLEISRQLSSLERACRAFIQKSGSSPKTEEMLERVRKMKARLA